jgi:hypothetical protein
MSRICYPSARSEQESASAHFADGVASRRRRSLDRAETDEEEGDGCELIQRAQAHPRRNSLPRYSTAVALTLREMNGTLCESGRTHSTTGLTFLLRRMSIVSQWAEEARQT